MPKKRRVKLDKTEPVEVVKEEPTEDVEVDEPELSKEEIEAIKKAKAEPVEEQVEPSFSPAIEIQEEPTKEKWPQPKEPEPTVTKGLAQFTITTPKDKFMREEPQVPLAIASLAPRLKKGESITIKRVN